MYVLLILLKRENLFPFLIDKIQMVRVRVYNSLPFILIHVPEILRILV